MDELELYGYHNEWSFDVNPLDWWKTHQKSFPTISLMSKKFLCIAATSVASERLFSKSGELVSKKRSRLSVSTVREIIFLNANQKWFSKGKN